MTARPTTAPLAVTLVAAAVALAACGDDDEPIADTAPSQATLVDTTPTESEVSVTSDPPTGTSGPLVPRTEPSRPPPPSTLPPSTGRTQPSDPTDRPPAAAPDVDAAAMAAIEDLAGRFGVEPASITVTADERVTWRDGSIGCPQPGVGYTQALVPGRRLILASGGETYAYHGARAGSLMYCESPDPNGAIPGGRGTDT